MAKSGGRVRKPIAPGIDPLMRRFVELADEQGISLGAVGEKVGISWRTIYDWPQGASPNFATFNAALNAIGYKLEIVPNG